MRREVRSQWRRRNTSTTRLCGGSVLVVDGMQSAISVTNSGTVRGLPLQHQVAVDARARFPLVFEFQGFQLLSSCALPRPPATPPSTSHPTNTTQTQLKHISNTDHQLKNMNCESPTPRVGSAQLKNFVGRKVIFVGRIEAIDNGLVHMQSPDGAKVVVQANSNYDAPFVEITGTVVDPGTIREESHVSFGENFGGCRLAGSVARLLMHSTPQQRLGTSHRECWCVCLFTAAAPAAFPAILYLLQT